VLQVPGPVEPVPLVGVPQVPDGDAVRVQRGVPGPPGPVGEPAVVLPVDQQDGNADLAGALDR